MLPWTTVLRLQQVILSMCIGVAIMLFGPSKNAKQRFSLIVRLLVSVTAFYHRYFIIWNGDKSNIPDTCVPYLKRAVAT